MFLHACGRSYSDGTYTAEVVAYNTNSGNTGTYELDVDIEDNYLITIHWPNGGWLDDSHFDPVKLDDEGYCYIESDQGVNYEIWVYDE